MNRAPRISISVDPTDLETGNQESDVMDESLYLAAIRTAVLARWPDAKITCLQVGLRQSDEWCRLNGADSDEVCDVVDSIDTTDEALYPTLDED